MKVRSSHKRSKRLVTTIVVVVIVLLIGMALPRAFHAVSTIMLAPFGALHTWITTSSDMAPVFFRDRVALNATIKQLQNDIAVAGGENLTLERLRSENERLRSLLGIVPTDRIGAAVIARPSNLPYDLLQLDRGSRHGVVSGAPVYIGEDRFIGMVADVAPTHSFVVLLTHPEFSATGFIDGADVIAMIDGIGGGVARVRVPQGVTLTVGDLVHVPSVEPGVFGRIVSVESRPTQPEQYGYITPDLSLSSIHLVSIGREPLIPPTPEVVNERIVSFLASSTLVMAVGSSTATTTSTSTETITEDE